MANKVGFKLSGVHEVKLGKTFTKGYKDEAYHTIRYDFKPASVDSQNVGTMEVVDKEVTLNVPLTGTGSAGSSQEAVFKGFKTPCVKEYLLSIDHTTGELVLERFTNQIRVKKTRIENAKRKPFPQERESKKLSPSQNHSSSSSQVSRHSPSHRSPPSKSPSRVSNTKSQTSTSTSDAGSMPMLNFEEEQKGKTGSIMSDSSSDSDSNSGSSSSCDSDSDSDTEVQSNTQTSSQNYTANGHPPKNGVPNSQISPSVLSDLELSEED